MKNNRVLVLLKLTISAAVMMMPAALLAQEALPKSPPIPKNNPMTPEKIELGKQLFFDPRLSNPGTISCNSCHNVMAGGDDNRAFSVGFKAQLGGRSAPTVWNSAYQSIQFWDGRAADLEEQSKGPLINPVEMGMDGHNVVIARIEKIKGYQVQFEKVFGKNSMNIDNVAKAIAAYERTLITPDAPFDKYIRGNKKAMSAAQVKGFETFKTVGCIACHTGPNFSGPALPVGTAFFQKFPTFPDKELEKKYALSKDLGRYDVTKAEGDKNLFRVPTLRNIAWTAPYFHNGSVQTLNEAVRIMAKTQLNRVLTDEEAGSIETFLGALTGVFPKQTMPRLPETPGTTLLFD